MLKKHGPELDNVSCSEKSSYKLVSYLAVKVKVSSNLSKLGPLFNLIYFKNSNAALQFKKSVDKTFNVLIKQAFLMVLHSRPMPLFM